MRDAATAEIRYLAPRTLMVRWDCSKSSVYRALDEMTRMGIYRGIFVGKDRRVALAAVEVYERHLERRTTLQGTCAPSPGGSAAAVPRYATSAAPSPAVDFRAEAKRLLALRRKSANRAPKDSSLDARYQTVLSQLYTKQSDRRRVSTRVAASRRGGRP